MRTALLTAALVVITTLVHAEPVAIIVHLTGDAQVNQKKAHLLQRLEPNDTVKCLPGGMVGIAMMTGGQRFQLSAGQTGKVRESGIAGAAPVAGLRPPSLEATRKLANSQAGVNFARPLGDAADITPEGQGYFDSGTRHFKWDRGFFQSQKPASYRFSLFDRIGNLLWSATTPSEEVDCPAGVPLPERDPTGFPRLYIWRLDAYKSDGTPIGGDHEVKGKWGVFSYLNADQARSLKQQEKRLQEEIAANPRDLNVSVRLARKFLEYGIPMKAVTPLLDRLIELKDRKGSPDWNAVESALDQVYRQIGSVAIFFAGFDVPEDRPQGTIAASAPAPGSERGVFISRPLGEAADLAPGFPGWLPSGTRHVTWHRQKGSPDLFQTNRSDPTTRPVTFRFSLFDGVSNLLWSDVTPSEEIELPDLHLKDNTPYIWRIDPYKRDGSPVGANGGGKPRWGIITFLDAKRAEELANATKDLRNGANGAAADPGLPALLAVTYRAEGVPMGAIVELSKLDDQDPSAELKDIYNSTGKLAAYFAGFNIPKDRKDR